MAQEQPTSLELQRCPRPAGAACMARDPDDLRRLVRCGLPPARRWQVWKEAVRLGGGPGDRELSTRYDDLRGKSSDFAELIEVDPRLTFPKDEDFTEERRRLASSVLNAYAIWDSVVGYCQGMNYLVGLLALLTDVESDVFSFFVRLMQHFMLSGFFSDGFPLLRRGARRASPPATTCSSAPSPPCTRRPGGPPALRGPRPRLPAEVAPGPLRDLAAGARGHAALGRRQICEGLSVLVPATVSILRVVGDSLLEKPSPDLQQFFRKTSTIITREEVAEAMQGIGLIEIPDYVTAYLEDAGAFSGVWERLKRRLLPWTHRQRGIAALLDCEMALDGSPPL
ncbi:unnamed protein product [Prorocentrum cordatum]|uniref:Rab-GAP TBC domain-containing protein n=1 Tax=Prorocentrum cordatum TaxID=2364126 RepID=A0ABN9UFA0_9DINO|nr:unnamed protein product [Polarella glacialis]